MSQKVRQVNCGRYDAWEKQIVNVDEEIVRKVRDVLQAQVVDDGGDGDDGADDKHAQDVGHAVGDGLAFNR